MMRTMADDGGAALANAEAVEVEVDNAVLTGSNLAFFGTPFPGFVCLSTRGLTLAFAFGIVKVSLGFLP